MRFFLTVSLMLFMINSFAQKKLIDSAAYKYWPSISEMRVSGNGKFVTYVLENVPRGKRTTVVQSTEHKWKRSYSGTLLMSNFNAEGTLLLFITGKDSLAILTLGTSRLNYISDVSSYSLQESNDGEWLCYGSASRPGEIFLLNLKTNKKRHYQDVDSWKFNEKGKSLFLWRRTGVNAYVKALSCIDLLSGKESKVWEGTNGDELILDSRHEQLAFASGDSIWYYKVGYPKPTGMFKRGLVLGGRQFEGITLNKFSKDGKCLFVSLKEKEKPKTEPGRLEIWSYLDVKLKSEAGYSSFRSYLAAVNLNNQKITLCQDNPDDQVVFGSSENASDTLVLIRNEQRGNENWSITSKTENKLLFIKSGKRLNLDFLDNNRTVSISSAAKFLFYYSFKYLDYFSYEIATGKIRNLTKGLNSSWAGVERDDLYKRNQAYPRGISNLIWLKDDEAVLVYDRYDIWKIDPTNNSKPVNLTNHYGQKNQIVFSFVSNEATINGIDSSGKLYLNAFNMANKENGFYLAKINKQEDPERLTMGANIFCSDNVYANKYGSDFRPIKASNAKIYIVRQMGASDFPNYYSTSDFKNFKRLSDLHPEKNYNWYTTELHKWNSLDGRVLKGVLYKPENFDPKKTYPVIFHYYERKSDVLNAYIKPESLCNSCNINIPTYVSQGYLVFMPDIYFEVGDPMQGTYDAVVSAAKYVADLPFVNAKKMGIQGCSFGGIQTDYLIANTTLFAAACSAAGYSDWVGAYGSVSLEEGVSLQGMFETGQPRMGSSLWENPEKYLKNSALLNAYKVTTPLLMMNNKLDGVIPYNDAIAFFTGLRRLGKKVWLLSYRNGGHGVVGKEADDFSFRMMQFFDHYLKGKPAPLWMTRGTNTQKGRGLNAGFEYDAEIKTPGLGLLKPKEQAIVDSLMTRKPITVTFK